MGKQVNELDALSEFTDDCVVPTHNGVGLKKGTIGALTEYLGTKFSNPNLLINPDFAINQRRESVYTVTTSKYTVDRWKAWNVKVTPQSNGIKVENVGSTAGSFIQTLEKSVEGEHTFSCYAESVSGKIEIGVEDGNGTEHVYLKQGLNSTHTSTGTRFAFELSAGSSMVLNWAKLEKGSHTTKFIKPIIYEELEKCKRFYLRYPLATANDTTVGPINLYVNVPLGINMYTVPTIALTNNNIQYILIDGSTSPITKTVTATKVDRLVDNTLVITLQSDFGYSNWKKAIFFDADESHFLTLDAEIY